MSLRTPAQIKIFLDRNRHRLDVPVQTYGDEPNSYRKDWDSAATRTCIFACWAYEQACHVYDTLLICPESGLVRIGQLSGTGVVDCGGSPESMTWAGSRGTRPVVKVSADGHGVTCTPDHLIRVARPLPWDLRGRRGPSKGERIRSASEEWVRADALQPGDFLKTYYGQNHWAAGRVSLSSTNPPGSLVTFPAELTPELAWLLGLLATDGIVSFMHGRGCSGRIRWFADHQSVLDRLTELVPAVFGKQPVTYVKSGCAQVTVELSSTPLVIWLRDIVGFRNHEIPDVILRSPRDVVAAFLTGMFDGDGYVNREAGAPGLDSCNEQLILDAVALMMNMGAPMSVRVEQAKPGVHMTQSAAYRPIYRAKALWAADMDWSWLWLVHSERAAALQQWVSYEPKQLGRCKSADGVSYAVVSSVIWAGEAEVFDVTVPSTQAFTANGIVVHNSGNQAIPMVYQSINEWTGYDGTKSHLCDRSYFPSTPHDLRVYEEKGIPIYGIESQHQLKDFDVIGTSISYPVLSINLVKQLMMSGIAPRWSDRHEDAGAWPMVICGGQSYGAPEVVANVVDAWFCFAGDTEVLTRDGVRRLADMEGQEPQIWDGRDWRKAEIRSFGVQQLNSITFAPAFQAQGGWRQTPKHYRRTERATANHRWELVDGTVTSNLRTGDLVRGSTADGFGSDEYAAGWLHGLAFGDGYAVKNRPGSYRVELHGDKARLTDAAQAAGATVRHYEGRWSGIPIVTWHSAEDLKTLPHDPTAEYAAGFLAAWIECDADQPTSAARRGAGSVRLASQDEGALAWLEAHAALAGWTLRGWCDEHPITSAGQRHGTLRRFTLSLAETAWKVTAIEPDATEQVFCAVVPEIHRFTLASGIYTSNCGEVEDEEGNPGIGAVLDRVDVMKRSGRWTADRLSCYADLAREFGFLYFPCFYDVHYAYEDRRSVVEARTALDMDAPARPSKQVHGITAREVGVRMPVVKRFVKDLNGIRGLDNPPLLYLDPAFGAGDAEASRGCPAWCTFCALTYRQKPYRQRSVDYMVDFGQRLMRNTGGTMVNPTGPDFPMHTQKVKLISSLLEQVTDRVDASSMRVDDFIADDRYIVLQAHGGMDTVTLGVEGNSQRMRDLVGKGAADEDVREAVARGIRAGIKKFKLYMIAALPGEDEGDIYRIMSLAKDLADIRDSMGSNALFQFSWTPLLIEANTPMQWFAPTAANYALGDVWEELRGLGVQFKLGGKAQKDRLTYFQLSQRASREVGAAMVDAVCEMNMGCWGGAPRGLHELLERKLVEHGFLNGLADCYDERAKQDMFGWEVVDQGINPELMWMTYQQMKEFLENTDSATYDEQFTDDYHGSEWIERCDSKCMGKTCGVCDVTDLKIRRNYIVAAASETKLDLGKIKVIDQSTQAMRVRMRVRTSVGKRMVGNDYWRTAVRRAAYRSGLPVAKRTIEFSSDAVKYKDWTCGTAYVEVALTRRVGAGELDATMAKLNAELADCEVTDWASRPVNAPRLRRDVDLSLYALELGAEVTAAQAAIERWNEAEYVPLKVRDDVYGVGLVTEEVNGKDLVGDMWLARDGHTLVLKAMIRGRANPYEVHAALFGQGSWIKAAQYPCVRLESFAEQDDAAYDSFSVYCADCGAQVPNTLLDKPFDTRYCPHCKDEHEGVAVNRRVRIGA